jgi:hypothetical protein
VEPARRNALDNRSRVSSGCRVMSGALPTQALKLVKVDIVS